MLRHGSTQDTIKGDCRIIYHGSALLTVLDGKEYHGLADMRYLIRECGFEKKEAFDYIRSLPTYSLR